MGRLAFAHHRAIERKMGKAAKDEIVVYAGPDKTTAAIYHITDPSNIQILRRSNQFTAVQLRDGRRGFIESEFLRFSSSMMELKQDKVPMYESASTKSRLKTTLCKGHLIECLDAEVNADGVSWLPIKSPHGQSGYIRGDTRRSPPSRFYYLRDVPKFYFWNVGAGAVEILIGLTVTAGSFLLASTGQTGGWFLILYGLIFVGGAHCVLATVRLRDEIAIQRRRHQERMNRASSTKISRSI